MDEFSEEEEGKEEENSEEDDYNQLLYDDAMKDYYKGQDQKMLNIIQEEDKQEGKQQPKQGMENANKLKNTKDKQ